VRSIIFDRPGPPAEVLTCRPDREKPTPGRGEVLVRMLASPVNPSDLLFVEGRYGLKPRLPATPGFEGVGVVEQSGGGIIGWLRNGKRVAVINDRTGNWQDYAVVPARQVVPVPANVPDEQAASFFVNPATALALTGDVLRVRRGEWLLQTAAGSALGKMVIQLGRRNRFRTINVVRRREQVEELKKLGADEVLCEADGPFAVRVKELTGGAGVRCAIDPVGGATGTQVVQALAAGGTAVLYGLLSGEAVSVDPRFLITGSKRVQGFWLTDWMKRQRVPRLLRLFRQIGRLLGEGTIQTEVAATYPLEQIKEAVTHAAAGGKGGKVLLRIADR
jgi:NADPH:quinone reductase-like Zn-dependent oxidoreductase